MCTEWVQIIYLFSSVCFILALKGLSSPKSARFGNILGIIGMLSAICATFYLQEFFHHISVIAAILIAAGFGTYIALKIPMTAMPQLVAGFHSLVGLAAVLVAYSALLSPESFGIGMLDRLPASNLLEMSLGSSIGALTFTGSIIAFAKLQAILPSKPIKFFMQQFVSASCALGLIISIISFSLFSTGDVMLFHLIVLISLVLGVLLIIPVGGADMPVIVSMLNSYSGWAAAGIGFTLENNLLIITGALVGSSGAILSYVMCKAMNRSIGNVIFGAFYSSSKTAEVLDHGDRQAKASSPEDAAYLLANSGSVIIVPGYGMAVAQAQHMIKELVELLEEKGVSVRFAIHPVAGRMPGHMNVLLAEANIDYEKVLELEEINGDFQFTDVALVIGANDVTNPAAKNDPDSPIYGMPILDVEKAKTVLFIKRSMASGYAGIENELFYHDNTLMLFGDAKKVVEEITKALNED